MAKKPRWKMNILSRSCLVMVWLSFSPFFSFAADPVPTDLPSGQKVDVVVRYVRITPEQKPSGYNFLLHSDFDGPKGPITLHGIFTAEQTEKVVEELKKMEADFFSAMSTTTLVGHQATIESLKEFPYPEDASILGGKPNSIIDRKKIGQSVKLTALSGPDGYTFDLNLELDVCRLDGFVDYRQSAPRFYPAGQDMDNGLNDALQKMAEGKVPVFSNRSVKSEVTLYDGATVLFEITPPPARQKIPIRDNKTLEVPSADNRTTWILITITAHK